MAMTDMEYVSVYRNCATLESVTTDSLVEAWDDLSNPAIKVLAVLKIDGDSVELVPKPEPKYWAQFNGGIIYPSDDMAYGCEGEGAYHFTVYRENDNGDHIRLSDEERDAFVEERRK